MKDLTKLAYKFQEIALGDIAVFEPAQRTLRASRVAQILGALDLDAFGEPVVSHRDGRYYVIDGQHRVKALAEFIGSQWERQLITCKVYEGMAAKDEARMFRMLNTVLRTTPFDTFKVGITEGREEETRIASIVEAAGLHIDRNRRPGAISAVTSLRRGFALSPKSLLFSLKLASASFGDSGLDGPVIEGFAQLHHRYTAALDDETTVEALGKIRGGYKGLITAARKRQLTIGNSLPVCIAAEAVDVINRHRKSKKLPSWWASSVAA